ncbi:type II secretion system protein [Candidatus Saganbacteria bacterium]|uniref:Type II secretion system protein n=1 Tax=Candidatus Saganbacteria bacterium TaxID=2575572 RepID=A0A9D6UJR8_UNCSA|nr:type II secretion system protein [Candidatus Saganbacteria bacterium]
MKSNKPGFTLIEAVVVISLLAIVSFGIGGFILTSMQNWMLTSGREAAVNNARNAMNRVTAELRRINKPANILTAASSKCAFVDISTQVITFEQSAANLLRNSDILAAGLGSPEGLRFTYLDANGNVTAVTQDIRSIRVWLFLFSGGQSTTLESSARIRTL